jgi:uncharacterized protein DUF4192
MTALDPLDPVLRTPVKLPVHDHGLVAATVPHLLGFHPSDSLVLVTLTDRDPPGIGVTIRVDLPPPWHAEMAARSLVEPLVVNDVGAVSLVLSGSSREDPDTPKGGWTGPDETGPPHRPLVEALTRELAEEGIEVLHALWLPRHEAGQTWWCYEDPECSGQLPDPASTPLAAASVLAGEVTYHDREELAATLAPIPRKTLRRTATLLSGRAPDDVPPKPLSLLLEAMPTADELTALDACERVAALIAALWPPDVRTACLTMAIDERAPGAERLWTVLTRAAPPPWRAEPACLLAISAYARGAGALAAMAVAVALDADPDHGFASLLDQALRLGLPRREVRRMLTDLATTNLDDPS